MLTNMVGGCLKKMSMSPEIIEGQEVYKKGDWVILKQGKLPGVKIRRWYVKAFEEKKILLRCHEDKYTLEVAPSDIEPDHT